MTERKATARAKRKMTNFDGAVFVDPSFVLLDAKATADPSTSLPLVATLRMTVVFEFIRDENGEEMLGAVEAPRADVLLRWRHD